MALKVPEISQENMLKALDTTYSKVNEGIPKVSKPVQEMAQEYLDRYPDINVAVKKMVDMQKVKCTTSGFLSGLGGAIVMPVTIPANVGGVLYVQMRMIASVAYMGGFDLSSDEVQTFVYACLAGVSVNAVVKKFGVNLGIKLATKGIQKIPGKVLTKINQKVAFRLITKFGEKGLINLGKLIPVVGGIINGGLDLAETNAIANRAVKMFIDKDFAGQGEDVLTDEEIVEADLAESNVQDDTESPATEKSLKNSLFSAATKWLSKDKRS